VALLDSWGAACPPHTPRHRHHPHQHRVDVVCQLTQLHVRVLSAHTLLHCINAPHSRHLLGCTLPGCFLVTRTVGTQPCTCWRHAAILQVCRRLSAGACALEERPLQNHARGRSVHRLHDAHCCCAYYSSLKLCTTAELKRALVICAVKFRNRTSRQVAHGNRCLVPGEPRSHTPHMPLPEPRR